MKLKVTAFLVLISVSIFFVACDKEDEKTQTCKIVKESYVQGTDTMVFKYSYNADGNLIRHDMDEDDYMTYTWETGKVTIKNYLSGALYSTEVVTLNSDGYANSSTYTRAGSSSPKSNNEFEYNNDGFLIQKTVTQTADANDIQTYTFEYEEGNLTLQTFEHNKTGYYYYSETAYQYYTDKPGNYNISLPVYGKPSKNLIKKTTLNVTEPVELTVTTSYTYEFEPNGNVKARTMNISGTSTKIIPTYECK